MQLVKNELPANENAIKTYTLLPPSLMAFHTLVTYDMSLHPSQSTQNICIKFIQRRPNVFDVGPTLYKCYTNVLCLLGYWLLLILPRPRSYKYHPHFTNFASSPIDQTPLPSRYTTFFQLCNTKFIDVDWKFDQGWSNIVYRMGSCVDQPALLWHCWSGYTIHPTFYTKDTLLVCTWAMKVLCSLLHRVHPFQI